MDPSTTDIENKWTNESKQYRQKKLFSGRHSLRIWRLRKRWEKETNKTKTVPTPFVPLHVRNKRESMLVSLLLLFAIVQCICGFVFPICDAFALTDKWNQFAINHKYYMEGFLLVQYVGGILSLAYLQFLIYWFQRPTDGKSTAPKYHSHSTGFDSANEPSGVLQLSLPKRKTQLHEVFEPTELHELTTRQDLPGGTQQQLLSTTYNGTRMERLTWHQEGMNLYMRLGAVGFGLGVMINDGFSLSSAWEISDPICHSLLWIPKHLIRLIWVLWQTYFVFKYHRVVLHANNFTVRIAFTHLAVINLCHWLNAVLREISETLKNGEGRDNNSTSAIFEAMFGMLSSHELHFHSIRDNTTDLLDDGHLATNLSELLMDVIKQHNLTNVMMLNQRRPVTNCKTHLGQMLRPFLFPFAIEYSLITGTLFYKLLQRVGDKPNDTTLNPLGTHALTGSMPILQVPSTSSLNAINYSAHYPSLASILSVGYTGTPCEKHRSYRQTLGCRVFLPPLTEDMGKESGTESPEGNKNFFKHAVSNVERRNHESYCHRSHTGLFLGLMLFLATVTCIILFLGRNKHSVVGTVPHLYQYSMMIVLTVGVFTGLMAIIQTNQLKFRRISSSESFEYNLLGLGLVGCLTYHMLLFVPSLETIVHVFIYRSAAMQSKTEWKTVDAFTTSSLDHMRGTAWLYIVKCTLEVFHALIQFFFIVEASRRGPCCPNQAAIKPGRSAIVFLLITNLALWMINTFEVRQMENRLALHRQYYGIRTWSVITCCLVPLIIFFRFHATVCLAQLWASLYKLR